MEVTGGTPIVETIDGTPNAYQVAKRLIDHGCRGRWVLVLGTNDTADVYAGSNVGRIQRIKEMMSLIGDQPVLWIEVKSLVPGGPYAEQNMRLAFGTVRVVLDVQRSRQGPAISSPAAAAARRAGPTLREPSGSSFPGRRPVLAVPRDR